MANRIALHEDIIRDAMLAGLMASFRKALREKILERIEPDIQASIDAACESFKATLQSYTDMEHMQHIVRLIIERKDKEG